MKKGLVLFVSVLFVLTAFLTAQESGGGLIGTVVTEDGAPVPGVAVMLKGPSMVGEKVSVTNVNGKFRFTGVPSGTYTVTFTLEGFNTIKRKVDVEIGKTFEIKQAMTAGTLEEEIEITGKAPAIDVRKSASSVSVNKNEILSLPTGREILSIADLAAGASSETVEGGGLQINGASSSENTYYVDGLNTTALEGGTSGQGIDAEATEELQVKKAGYAAEFGGSMGGVLNIITKSGGNEFHGSVGVEAGHNALTVGKSYSGANDKYLRLNPEDNTVADYGEVLLAGEDEFLDLRPKFNLGGYIIKDKLWFFTSFSPRFQNVDRKWYDVNDPDDPNTGEKVNRKLTYYLGNLKLTGALTPNLRVSLGGAIDLYERQGDLPSSTGTTSYGSLDGLREDGWKTPIYSATGQIDYTLGNNTFVRVNGGYYYKDSYSTVEPPGDRRILFQYSNEWLNPPTPHGRYWSNISFAEINADSQDLAEKIQVGGKVTHYMELAGEHEWKLGFQYNHHKIEKNNGVSGQYWRFWWRQPDGTNQYYYTRTGEVYETTYGYVRDYYYGELGGFTNDGMSLFIQDGWTINNRLTINVGVRAEQENYPSASVERPEDPFSFGFLDKIAPRLSVALDVNGDGKNKVYGSFGAYYDVMKYDMVVGSFGGAKYYRAWYDIATLDWEQYLDVDGWNWNGNSEQDVLGGQLFEVENLRQPSHDLVQPDIKPYSKWEATLGYERELTEDLVGSVEVMYNWVANAIEDIGVTIGSDEFYFIGNPGSDWINQKYRESEYIPIDECPAPNRQYVAATLQLRKQYSNNWFGEVSATFSRLWGNFGGLASSDENGRQDPNVERYWDQWFLHYDQNMNELTGPLNTDRFLRLKGSGAYSFDFGLTVGATASLVTGTPLSRELSLNNQQGYYPLGRGSDGRNKTVFNVNLKLSYDMKLSNQVNLNLYANVFNLTNSQMAMTRYRYISPEDMELSNAEILAGYDYEEEMAKRGINMDPRFLMDTSFKAPLSARVGVKITF